MTKLVIDNFPKDDETWMVAEFGKVKWNEAVPDEPLVQVILSNMANKESKVSYIAKSLTSYVTKGSTWINGERDGDIPTAVTVKFRFDSIRDFQTISAWQNLDIKAIWDESFGRYRKIR